ncbi:unnamed protein product [Brassicogethes aeneus]|uniref:O-acyltransferase n=1 Tax=Brassicogethes aeneus TaxID=1431903 RepID=A0A9P0FH86_BRAAE|nr:unnamed protein product [Brassicogethes aeneus]
MTETTTKIISSKNTQKEQAKSSNETITSKVLDKEKIISKLPILQLKNRNSILTDLFENQHIKAIQHLFIAIMLSLAANTIVYEYQNFGRINFGTLIISQVFEKIHISIGAWLIQLFSIFLGYLVFNFWARLRNNFFPKTQKIWDILWGTMVLVYYVTSFRFAVEVCNKYKLPIASAAIITLETTRMLMKFHSFIRENIPKVLNHKPKSEEKLILSKFSKLLYFLFAPTLLYRDEYPRTSHIRWKFVFENLLQVIATVFTQSFIFETLMIPIFGEFGQRSFTISEIVFCLTRNFIPGMFIIVSTFYLLLHCWMNMFAEMLTFGDRRFYIDWWNVTNFSEYFRKWNTVVGDWLYTYIYKDIYELVIPNKIFGKFMVFVVSCIVHEWIMCYSFGFFFPVLSFFFLMFGMPLSFLNPGKSDTLNTLFLFGLFLGGGGLTMGLYIFESMARQNDPIENPPYQDFFIPRCIKFVNFNESRY